MTQLPNSLRALDQASLIHPQSNLRTRLEEGPTIMTRGNGIFVYDDAGKEYLEAAAGLWCASLGFGVERLAKVAYDQMCKVGYYHIYRDTSNETAIELAAKLLEIAPVPMSKVFFQCSGSEANDTAVKIVWYYWHAMGKPERKKIIGRLHAYHGSTCAASSISGKPDMHFESGLPFNGFLHTEYPNYYRCQQGGESEEEFSSRMAASLEQLILEEGPETVAAFWAEPVMGAGGAVIPPAGYFEKIQAVLQKYDILFVADEVICGFGRTGNMWGSQTFSLKPDMVSCAKALSAGLQPISALMLNERVFQGLMTQSDKVGHLAHGYTYAGHPVTTAVALETLKIYDEMDVVGHVRNVEPTFVAEMTALEDHPLIGEFRGIGLIGALEVVKDKTAREPYPSETNVIGLIGANARKHGLILRLIGNRIAFSPPQIISSAEISEMAKRLKLALDDTYTQVRVN
ncbi:MAG: aminotransferase class III-fold pyridoxal phosphate-dependent enzyme [Hyphomicrobiaceae bacterium TMED74]|nr:aspartate aminotransferase family protein [Filomicrobium sp.]MAI47247.1 aspartate aminotransferase family protein [Filomicrobium sp.]RPG39120.1 MAG: aminotransferase class III-fold pyridoxal phosphate-dependent enzyme [Hyphomicrobiaceae bacterium TMED74]RPG42123.1 MAG: aminotransferase class III-fold pyridoxal phosphate-dependent enzyme [Hyphomicrobiaceae bacterium TMED74]